MRARTILLAIGCTYASIGVVFLSKIPNYFTNGATARLAITRQISSSGSLISTTAYDFW